MTMRFDSIVISRRTTVSCAALALIAAACGSPRGNEAAPVDARGRTAEAPDSVPGVPRVVGDAFRRLDGELDPAGRDTIRAMPPEEMFRLHHGLGMYVRNEYGLWQGSPLQDFFFAKGVRHPDDMSTVLLDAYRLYLRGEPVRLDSIIAAMPPPPVEMSPEPALPDSEKKS